MDLSSVFQTEVFRPIVQTLIPGVTALTPFLFLVEHYFPGSALIAGEHEATAAVLVVLAAVAAGFILEDVGSRIEVTSWRFVKTKTGDDEWYKFLKSSFQPEPYGIKYMADIVLRMKFENSFASALLLNGCGLVWLRCVGYIKSTAPTIVAVVVIVALAAYLLFEAYSSTKLLQTLRAKLVNP